MRARAMTALLALALAASCSRPGEQSLSVAARRADFERLLTVRGRLEAVETLTLAAGAEGKLAFMAAEGAFVKAGDRLFGLETAEMEDGLQRTELDLTVAQSGLEKAGEDIRSEAKKNELSRQEKTRQLDFQRLSARIAREDLEKKRRQVEKQILARSELAAAELAVEQAELSVKNAEIDLERFEEEASSRAQTLRLDRQVAEARLEKARAEVDEARTFLEKATVVAPRDGVVIHTKNWRGVSFKIGDEVWNGVQVMELPDLAAMRVAVDINEVDVADAKPGLPARVRVDAFPDLLLEGTLSEVAGMAVEVKDRDGNATGLRVFEAKVSLARQDERLRPGMTARVELILDTRPGALVVPTGAVEIEGGSASIVMAGGERRPVTVAASNADLAVIASGLEEGELVRVTSSGSVAGASGAAAAGAPP